MDESDKEITLELVRKFHRESSELLTKLYNLHIDEAKMTTEENIMGKLHDAIHVAQNQLLYGRDTIWEEDC